MTGHARIAASLVLAAATWGLGRFTAPVPEPPPIQTEAEAPDLQAWRAALDEARTHADAGTLRTEALDVLDTAESDLHLVDAIALLGWTGDARDAEWLHSVALSRDPELERAAIASLGRIGDSASVAVLLQLEAERRLRPTVVDSLGYSDAAEATARLLHHLDDPQLGPVAARALARQGHPGNADHVARALRAAAPPAAPGLAMALAEFPGDQARDLLYDVLRTGSPTLREASLTALAHARDPIVLDLLLADLEQGTARNRAAAAHHLGSLGDPRATHALHQAALSGNREVYSAAVSSLARIDTGRSRSVLLELIDVGPDAVATQAAWVLPEPEAEDAVAVLTSTWRRRGWEVRSAITQRLFYANWTRGEVPDAVLALARAELADPPPGGNTNAPGFLLDHGDDQDIRAVQTLLEEGPSMLRMRVVQALAQWPGASADQLLFAQVDDGDPNVRDAAVRALLQRGIDAEELEAPLLAALRSDLNANGQVDQLLVELGTPDALAAVQARLRSGTRRERQAAMQALAWSGDSETAAALLDVAADEEDPDQRRQIYQSVVWSAGGNKADLAERLLDDDAITVRSLGIQVLANSGPDAREQLLELAQGDEPQERMEALGALARAGGPEAEALLIAALDEDDTRGVALSALSQLQTPGSRRALVDAARDHDDPSVRVQAIHQLTWNPAEGGPDAIREALQADDDSVRTAALGALESIGTTAAAETLAGMLDDPDDPMAIQAAHAIERMGGEVADQHASRIADIVEGAAQAGDDVYFGDYVDDDGW